MKIILDYIWLDGETISDVCYLTKIIDADIRLGQGFGKTPRLLESKEDLDIIPEITFGGAYTKQEPTGDNHSILKPMRLYMNPLKENSYFVICEVYDGDEPHTSNSRHILKDFCDDTIKICYSQNFLLFEKDDGNWEFDVDTHFINNLTYSSKKTLGDELINELINCAIKMGLSMDSVINKFNNGAIWEFITGEDTPLTLSDDNIVLRHLLYRLSKKHKLKISFDNNFFRIIESPKDKINDPYLLTKKLTKSFVV